MIPGEPGITDAGALASATNLLKYSVSCCDVRVLPSRISTYFPYAPVYNIQGFLPFCYPIQSASGKRKISSFFFFPTYGFTLGIPSIFKIRISTLDYFRRSRRISHRQFFSLPSLSLSLCSVARLLTTTTLVSHSLCQHDSHLVQRQ